MSTLDNSTGYSTIFETVSSPAALSAAWLRVRASKGGGEDVTLTAFGREANANILRLSRMLRDGSYRSGPYRFVDIPKPDGDTRRLSIPCVVDRVAQRAAADGLLPHIEPELEDASFAYRPGRSVRMAVDRVWRYRREGFTWVLDADIERFFDTVPHRPLLDRLEAVAPDARLSALVADWLAGYAPAGRGLPQGSPLSPLLSNLYLDLLDEKIAAKGVRLVRFADDFVVLCRSEAAAHGAKAKIARLLEGFGLRLHPEKTRVIPFERGFVFLGKLFVRSLVLDAPDDDEPATVGPRPITPNAAEDYGQPQRLPEVPDSRRPSARLRPLYVMEPGRYLDLRNDSFAVYEDGKELLAIPPGMVGRIELGPRVAVSMEALRHAADNGVPVALLNGWGEAEAQVDGPEAARAKLHLEQARHQIDPGRRLALARSIVEGRLRNQRALLRRLNRRRKQAAVAAAAQAIGRILRKLPGAADVSTAMGVEGEAAAHYWPALGACLEHGWRFDARRRRPPPDPVNLVLSWASAMLTRDLRAFVTRSGLHPGLGALHAARDGNDAAVFDLVEEFRAPLAEGLAIYLFNNRILQPAMFDTLADGTLHIEAPGRDAVIRTYEAWLDRDVKSPNSGERLRWRGLVEEQVDAYARHFRLGEPYRPYRMDH